jgi:hypothetical protein
MANSSKRRRRLWDTYTFPGFRPQPTVRGIFGDPKARLITLARRANKFGYRRNCASFLTSLKRGCLIFGQESHGRHEQGSD